MTTKKKYVSSREERAQATREKLLEAAIELVNQYGMKYLTVRNICDEAGVSTGSFYNLFDSKDDLVFYYLQNVFTEYKQQVENDASQQTDGIVLSKAFVRTEDGVSYVYKDVNGVLKKQIVKVKQNVNGGMYVLISGGLSMEDKIAFPYSKSVQEGVKTKEGSLDTFMGYDSTSYSGIG